MPTTPNPASDQAPGAVRPPGRAVALPADERRAAIVAATLPLLIAGGPAVTTRQIAQAAGIAEGTIFRVFPDKDAVLHAAVELAFDPAPTEAALERIDRSGTLEEQLAEAVRVVQERLSVIWKLVAAVGSEAKPPDRRPELTGLTRLLQPHAARLRHDPATAAQELRALTLAVSHPALVDEPLSPQEIVSLLLDGIRRRPDTETPETP